MERWMTPLVRKVRKLAPFVQEGELECIVAQMSQRSGISRESLLRILYEDLRNGIPFQYTAVGKSRSIAQWYRA